MFSPLEHQLLKVLKPLHLRGKKLLVAISGGVDSLAGLEALCRVQKAIGFELGACYVHHGNKGVSRQIQQYRSKAQATCEEFCRTRKIKFHCSEPSAVFLKNENELRVYRYRVLRELKQYFNYDLVVTVHHCDDVLETQMMRLMRGVGKEGLKAIRLLSKDLFRPFLSFSKQELEGYASEKGIVFCQDPSNEDPSYLRNSVRIWLSEIEEKHPGVLKSFSRSIENISERKTRPLPKEIWQEDALSRSVYSSLTQEDRLRALVEYHKRHNLTFPRHTQFKEILRQLDMSRNEHIFIVGLYEWRINASRIWARGRK